jgi:phosphoglycolate phosphatase
MKCLRAIPVERLQLLVFDLDGTLIDSRQDLANSINAMLANYGRHPLPEDVIASYIGDGAPTLVRLSLGDPQDERFVTEALTYFLDYYRAHKLDHTYVYDGVFPALDALAQTIAGQKMAVLSNKPVGPSRAICEALTLAPYFYAVYGGNSFDTKKPDALGLETLMRESGVKPEETVMIGDSDVDVVTARNAGAWAVGCTFGLAPHSLEVAPPDVLVDSPMEWLDALLAKRTS